MKKEHDMQPFDYDEYKREPTFSCDIVDALMILVFVLIFTGLLFKII